MTETCVDLFYGTGGFSSAFAESDDWDVFGVDVEESTDADMHADVMDLTPSDLPDADVVLCSIPCLLFSNAGNHDQWENKRPVGKRAQEHVCLAYHSLGLVKGLNPEWWFIENPRGRLRWLFGRPTGTVTYCQYGKPYQKPTDLWGRHPPGMAYKSCNAGEDCHRRNLDDDGTSAVGSMPNDYAERSAVPYELSKSILDAVDSAGDRDSHPTLAGMGL